MKILFSVRHAGALRNFASTIRELARRGHQIHLALMMQDNLRDERLLWEFSNDHLGITWAELWKNEPVRFWTALARTARGAADYLRYRMPAFEHAHALRRRACSRVPPALVAVLDLPLVRSRRGSTLAAAVLRVIERAIPTDRWVAAIIADQRPDLLLVTPLVDLASEQVDYVKAAKALGIRSGLCVHSWDNLTNKGLIHVIPDRVFVWNDAQKREAVDLHGVPPGQVVVTGAPVFDDWFARRPSTTREEFCRKVGLPPEKPFFVYLGSSKFIAPAEADFVQKWIAAVRWAPDPRVRAAGILIRPHPQTKRREWKRFDSSEFRDVVRWPRVATKPVDASSKDDYFDSMFHAAAAVGINTSAQIEAGIVGCPVYSMRVAEYAGTQEGTLHFHYLLNESGGLLHMADTLDEHVRALAGALERTGEERHEMRAFVHAFVRPNGLDRPATPLLADAIEELGRLPKPARQRVPIRLRAVQLALGSVVAGAKVMHGFRRKGQRQALAPLFQKYFVAIPTAYFFQWGPAKRFARHYIVPRVAPQGTIAGTPTQEMIAIPKVLRRLSDSSRPIVVGPWLNDVGTELLYWIPFLNWTKTYRSFDRERLVVVSRGGAAPWYRNITDRYLDVYDFYGPEQFHAKNARRLSETKKEHLIVTALDREVLEGVFRHLGTEDVELLHPRYMYRLFRPYWKGEMPLTLLETYTSFRRLPQLDASNVAHDLPRDYVAVRFHFNDAFPNTKENRMFVSRVVQTLADATDVVLLNPERGGSDHGNPEIRHPRVRTIDHLMTPRTNLEIQTKVISQARAFVGTYGGPSYLAPLNGVTALAFYSDREKVSRQELELAHHVFGKLKSGWYVLDTSDLNVLDLAFGGRGSLARVWEHTQEIVS